jgi:hypothetical protein
MSDVGGVIVLVPGLRGPEMQKWPELWRGPNGRPLPHLRAVAVPPDVYRLPLGAIPDVVFELYPAVP